MDQAVGITEKGFLHANRFERPKNSRKNARSQVFNSRCLRRTSRRFPGRGSFYSRIIPEVLPTRYTLPVTDLSTVNCQYTLCLDAERGTYIIMPLPLSIAAVTLLLLIVAQTTLGYRSPALMVRRMASLCKASRLTMETITVPRQQNPREYERLVLESVAATHNVVRWYIANFQNGSAIIEAVVETP